MVAVRLTEKAADADSLNPTITPQPCPRFGAGQCVVEVKSAGVNPSDAKAALGLMPHAIWPRTPGRDFAGIVIGGPSRLVGLEVWGSGGDLGIRRDGSHARYVVLDVSGVCIKPPTLTMREAGSVGVPFVTAYEGFRRAGMPQAGEVVLIMGGTGKVGQAAIQLATQHGARVFAVVRGRQPYAGHANTEITLIDGEQQDIAACVREQTNGHGADIVFNTVGSPYFAAANQSMAIGARQILISTLERPVPFDIFQFYRGQHTYVGIDSLALDHVACAKILRELSPGFASGALKPFPIAPNAVYSLKDAAHAYRAVLAGTRQRIVLEC
ncbi:zinc-binding alcohol dehydrogenase family protein [Noviherbaspirillum sp.]|uniref:quinone oxidoreductase family protein n=1 Tax=Noviherbaspirillum sp. TaxID=1926288 RepID=UPI002B471849|nr:zinc-binding alcohol dehydrogenase family protein [Noviherbaspirillum sp.]HJV81561.1 zinc-binding alcohol dehydrogenase family protein [Noviherbaspirillum sp.]